MYVIVFHSFEIKLYCVTNQIIVLTFDQRQKVFSFIFSTIKFDDNSFSLKHTPLSFAFDCVFLNLVFYITNDRACFLVYFFIDCNGRKLFIQGVSRIGYLKMLITYSLNINLGYLYKKKKFTAHYGLFY